MPNIFDLEALLKLALDIALEHELRECWVAPRAWRAEGHGHARRVGRRAELR